MKLFVFEVSSAPRVERTTTSYPPQRARALKDDREGVEAVEAVSRRTARATGVKIRADIANGVVGTIAPHTHTRRK
jgi:hypothetical protein